MQAAVNMPYVGREVVEAGVLLQQARHLLPSGLADVDRCLDRAAKLLSGERAPNLQAPTGGLAPWQLARTLRLIDERLEKGLTTAELAAAVRLSPSHFTRAFQKTQGCAPHVHIRRRRIDRAMLLMLTTRESLAEIALACGLADQAHLSRLFRQVQGETPNAWRRSRTGALAA